MCQEEIENFLKEKRGEYTASKMAKKMGISTNAALHGLRKLREHHEVRFKFDGKEYTYLGGKR